MGWDRPAAVDALAGVLGAATVAMVPPPSVFAQPPATHNPPALVIQYPSQVLKHVPAFPVDTATVSVLAVAGLDDPATVDALLEVATMAVEADAQLGGAVQYCRPIQHRLWRIVNVAGADYLTAELELEIRM